MAEKMMPFGLTGLKKPFAQGYFPAPAPRPVVVSGVRGPGAHMPGVGAPGGPMVDAVEALHPFAPAPVSAFVPAVGPGAVVPFQPGVGGQTEPYRVRRKPIMAGGGWQERAYSERVAAEKQMMADYRAQQALRREVVPLQIGVGGQTVPHGMEPGAKERARLAAEAERLAALGTAALAGQPGMPKAPVAPAPLPTELLRIMHPPGILAGGGRVLAETKMVTFGLAPVSAGTPVIKLGGPGWVPPRLGPTAAELAAARRREAGDVAAAEAARKRSAVAAAERAKRLAGEPAEGAPTVAPSHARQELAKAQAEVAAIEKAGGDPSAAVQRVGYWRKKISEE